MADLSCVDFLPLKYINEVIENSETTAVIRSNISSLSDINSWIDEFGFLSETKWNARSSKPSAEKFVCLKKFVCHHSAFKKIDSAKNKKGISKNFGCSATITAKIKLNTLATRKKDLYVKKGLVGVITINKVHNHSLQTGDTLRFLPADQHIKLKFFEYFNNGMGIAEACRHHEGLLEKTGDSSEGVLASGRINPSKRTVRYWHDQWLENSEQQMDESLSEQETEASLSESDEGTDEAEFVKNGSSMDDANYDEEHEEPLQITAIKEEVTEEETGYIHDDHTEKLDEITDEAELVKDESTVDEADCNEENEPFLNMVVKEEVITVEETGSIHNEHTEKDTSFTSVWIKEEVNDEEPELENEDEEDIEEQYMNESDEGKEAGFVKNGSSLDDGDSDEEPLQIAVIKEEVTKEETVFIHDDHTEKDASFTDVWIKEEVDDKEPELESAGEEEDIEEQYMNESDEGTDEAGFVKNGSSVNGADRDEEHEEPLQIAVTKEEVTKEETGFIHDGHTEKSDERSDEDDKHLMKMFVKNGSSVDDADCDEEHEEPLQIAVIKEGVTKEETELIHDDHTEKDAYFASGWINEEVDKEEGLENEDKEGEEEEEVTEEKCVNENVSLPAITTVVKEEVTVDGTESRLCKLELEQPETSTFFQDTSSPQTLLHQKSVEKNAHHCELDMHNKVSKSPSKFWKYKCDICNKVMKSRNSLVKHTFVHSCIRSFKCNVCNKSFKSSSHLTGHKLVHSNIRNHKCHTCGKSFKTFSGLNVHKLTHGTKKNYECDICQKAFRLPSSLSQHKSTHSEAKRYQCGICNKMFLYSYLLSQHELIHSGIKDYHCDICNKPFITLKQRNVHQKRHSDVKKYYCDICFKSFAYPFTLKKHKLSHSYGLKGHREPKSKDYQCDICNNAFVSVSSLIRHKEIHNGIKQYQCDICNKAYNWLTGLSVHKLTHTGIKYECDICSKTLSNASNLARHKLLKHTDIRRKCR